MNFIFSLIILGIETVTLDAKHSNGNSIIDKRGIALIMHAWFFLQMFTTDDFFSSFCDEAAIDIIYLCLFFFFFRLKRKQMF